MNKKYGYLLFVLLFLSGSAYTVEFTGTRAAGMGQSFIAVNGDIGGVYHNPGSLAGCDVSEIGFNIGSLYRDNKLGAMTGMIFTWPYADQDPKRLAVHWNNSGMGEQSVQETGITLAKNSIFLKYPFRFGGTLKWRSDTLVGKQGVMLDVGAQSDVVKQKVTVGMAINNLASPDKDMAETSLGCGVFYNSVYGKLTSDIKWRTDRFFMSLGFENDFYEGLVVTRYGVLNAPDSYITCGVSTYLWPLGFDIAFSFPYNSTPGSGYFQAGFRYRFGGPHFSEIYLDRSIEKAASLRHSIKNLEKKKSKLDKEIIQLDEYKKHPDGNILGLPGVSQEAKKKLIEKPKDAKKEEQRPSYEKKAVTWPQYHKVVPGDTLRSIAQKYYDDPNKWQFIYNVNKDKVERGQPRLGEELMIPKP
ncbi:MAG: LysM peptidoglycan-binding domain-containing protein [Elusimicrobia bacterium]|nr:LysM peptidoglycan-binding domain-containing protein [Candidatus Liberimonas magnetica]